MKDLPDPLVGLEWHQSPIIPLGFAVMQHLEEQ